jgi:N-acetylneuraminic acid mutarotase
MVTYKNNAHKQIAPRWIKLADLPYDVSDGCAVVLNNEIHILGGAILPPSPTLPGQTGTTSETNYNKHYKWDGTSWTSLSTLPFEFNLGSAVVLNGEIHIIGGGNLSSGMDHHYKWNGSSWESVSSLPFSFGMGSAVVLNDEIHILGGINTMLEHRKWNGSDWVSASTLPAFFCRGSAVVLNGEIHILGGDDPTSHYKWDGSAWVSVSTIPYKFVYVSAVVLDNKIHILGGGGEWVSHKALPMGRIFLDERIHVAI